MNDNSWMESPSHPFQVIVQKMMSTFEQKRFYYGSIWICQWQPAINYSSRLYCKVLFIYDIIDHNLILMIMYSCPRLLALECVCVLQHTNEKNRIVCVGPIRHHKEDFYLRVCVALTYNHSPFYWLHEVCVWHPFDATANHWVCGSRVCGCVWYHMWYF